MRGSRVKYINHRINSKYDFECQNDSINKLSKLIIFVAMLFNRELSYQYRICVTMKPSISNYSQQQIQSLNFIQITDKIEEVSSGPIFSINV